MNDTGSEARAEAISLWEVDSILGISAIGMREGCIHVGSELASIIGTYMFGYGFYADLAAALSEDAISESLKSGSEGYYGSERVLYNQRP